MRVICATAVLTGSATLTSCDSVTGPAAPALPTDAEQFSPPPVFSTWWQMTEACSGLSGSLGDVTWYKTAQTLHDPNTGELVVGYWYSGTNRIVLLASELRDGGAVRHEMLHALLRIGGHPRNQFLGKCAGTVQCAQACIAAAGRYAGPGQMPIEATADSIDVTVSVAPQSPGSGTDGGFFAVTVVARNRSSHWLTVPPASPALSATRTFSFDVRGPIAITGGEVATDPSQLIFAPGESKRQVFDFAVGDGAFSRQLLAGSYTVRGEYSDFWSSDVPFVIAP